MLNNLKALVFISVLAGITFWLAKPICLRFMIAEDFGRRRAVWFFLTAAAFVSPTFWMYTLLAVPAVLWAGSKDSNPAALFLLLFYAVPQGEFEIPKIFPLNHARMLVLFLALPALLWRRDSGTNYAQQHRRTGIGLSDVLLVSSSVLMMTRYWEYESYTNVTRRLFVDMLDTILPFLLLSRTLRDTKAVREALACLALCCVVMVPLAAFEAAKGWLIYVGVSDLWGFRSEFAYLLRAGVLRAQLTTGHSLRLGLLFAMGFGLSLYLMRQQQSRLSRIAVGVLMWVGLVAAYARGAWISGVLAMIFYYWQLRGGATRTVKALLVFGLLGAVVAMTSLGDRLINSLPFIGTVDSENVLYRQRLLEKALEVIPENFWFGDLHVTAKLQSLRQGQGIIDIVNGYLLIALYFGMLPLMILVGFYLTAVFGAWRASRRVRKADEDLSAMGAVLVACLLAALFFAWTAAFMPITLFIAGMAIAYARSVPRGPGKISSIAPAQSRSPART